MDRDGHLIPLKILNYIKMKQLISTITIAVLLFSYSCQSVKIQDEQVILAKPSATQYKWQEQERTHYIVFDVCTWQGREFDDHSTPLSLINPSKLNTDQWCEVAQSWGAKQILFTAKHTGGFCWWPSETTDYDISNTPYKNGKGDVVAELAASCKKYGLNLGLYIYPGDLTLGAGLHGGGETDDPAKQETYNEVFRTQYKEVLTNYGDIIEIWFDGGCVIPMADIIDKYAQNTVRFQGPHATIRWPGTESGKVYYPSWNTLNSEDLKTGISTQVHDDPDGDVWAPSEANTSISDHHWFWTPDVYGRDRKSVDQLMDAYYQSVGYGVQFVLGVAPDTTGLIQPDDAALFKAFGKEIDRRFKTPISELKNKKGHTVTLELPKSQKINHVITMEDYREGHRIREYVIEGLSDGKWVELAKGSAIGRKKIDYFEEVEISAVKFTATRSVAKPLVRSLSAYYVEDFVPPHKTSMSAWSAAPTEVFFWGENMFKNGELKMEIDLSKRMALPGQFMVELVPEGDASISIESVGIYFEGIKAMDQYIERLENNNIRINRTAMTDAESSSVLKLIIKADTPCNGKVTFKPALIYQ